MCLSKEMEENLSAMVDTSTTLKSYAEVSSEKLDSSKELRNILREEETNKKMAADEDNDRKKMEKNVVVHGIPEDVLLPECSTSFMSIVEELQVKVRIVDIRRLSRVREEEKPRPLRIILESKSTRQNILTNAHKLRKVHKFQKIYLKPDLTVKERSLKRELWLELKNKRSTDPDKR